MATLALKLFYFPARSRGESIRMMLHHGKIPYEDVIVTGEVFRQMKTDGILPLGQLPVLEVNGKLWPESGSMLRFVGKLTNTISEDPVEFLRSDSVLEAARGLWQIDPVVNRLLGEDLKSTYHSFCERLPMILSFLSTTLGEMEFFGGDAPTYADFGAWHYLDNTRSVNPDGVDFDNLKKWMERIEALPGVAEYLASRPSIPESRQQLFETLL